MPPSPPDDTPPSDPDSHEDVDGAAYDAFLDALEAGGARDVDSFLEDWPGTGPELRRRLERLSQRFGRGVSRPRDIGGLRVLGVLGSGGMGEVFEARDEALDRTVAVKVLTPAFASDPGRIERFEREARILAALDHPNVATIFALGRSAGAPPHIVMERVEGEDVAQALKHGPFGWRDAIDVCVQVARALAAAHERGIIHRDLKPSNVMLRTDGVVKVLDFGLAERVDQPSYEGDAPRRPVVGTPGYMSPEQARGERADERADVWSFGCIAYECTTGARIAPAPRSRSGSREASEPAERSYPEGIPPALERLIESCLTLDRDRRPADGAALVRAFQAILEGVGRGSDELPPLPVRRTRFIGRDRDLRALRAALDEGTLVTLVGPGGAGKSRLALEVAGDRSPVAWAELAAGGEEAVAQGMLRAIGARPGVAENPLDDLAGAFARRAPLLIVVDNCEHVLRAAAQAVAAALEASTDVRVLATSREPLGLQGEQVVRVEPLKLPSPEVARAAATDELLANDAVALFVERAVSAGCPPLADPGSAASAELRAAVDLCRRLDGLPLAIELAAARAASVGVRQLVDRLDGRASLLDAETRDGLAHHRSLSSLVDWSHDLLSGTERVLLRRLSVFADGWTLASAEEVTAADGLKGLAREDVLLSLSKLTSRSLVTRDATGGRWRFLETLKAYARGRLESRPEAAAVQSRYARRFLELAECAAAVSFAEGRLAAFLELESELPDLLAALPIALRDPELATRAFIATGELFEFWISRGLLRDGHRMVSEALEVAPPDVTSEERAGVILCLGTIEHRMGRYDVGKANLERALAIGRDLGDRDIVARARRNIGFLLLHRKDFDEAREAFQEALGFEREIGDQRRIGNLLNDLGVLAVYQGRFEEAVLVYTESLARRRAAGDEWGIAGSLGNLGEANHRLGHHAVARAQLSESLAGFRDLGDLRSVAESFEMSAALEVSVGDLDTATLLSGAAEGLRERFGFPIPKVEASGYAEDVARMRAGLGKERYDALRIEGKALSIDAALTLALGQSSGADTRFRG